MRRLVPLAAVAALLAAVAALLAGPAYARPDVPPPPVTIVEDSRSCPSGYAPTGYVGPPGARWKICQR